MLAWNMQTVKMLGTEVWWYNPTLSESWRYISFLLGIFKFYRPTFRHMIKCFQRIIKKKHWHAHSDGNKEHTNCKCRPEL